MAPHQFTAPNVSPLNIANAHIAAMLTAAAGHRELAAEMTPPRYRARASSGYGGSYTVESADGRIIDYYRTRSGAAHAAAMLNAGMGEISPHAVTGCRVTPRTPPHDEPAPIAADRDAAAARTTAETLSGGTIGTL